MPATKTDAHDRSRGPKTAKLKPQVVRNKLRHLKKQTDQTPSDYQEAIYRFVAEGEGNGIVQATAGSGKTTSIVNAMRFTPPTRRSDGCFTPSRVLYLVFNKKMQVEAQEREDMPESTTVQTTHGFGYSALRNSYPRPLDIPPSANWLKVDQYKTSNVLKPMLPQMEWNAFRKVGSVVRSVVSYLKNQAITPDLDPQEDENYQDLIRHLVADSLGHVPTNMADYIEWCIDTMEESQKDLTGIEFDDMIYLPAIDPNITFEQYDWVFVDESQDLNPAQISMLKRYAEQHPSTRFLFVGDNDQSIYLFRGAAPDAMDQIKTHFSATELPLTISYRCPKAVVAEAKRVRPSIEASPFAAEGRVTTISQADFWDLFQPGDLALCRTNAPLISYCIAGIKRQLPATVVGADIGRSLLSLFNNEVRPKLRTHDNDCYAALQDARAASLRRLNRPGDEQVAANLDDRYEALLALLQAPNDTYDTLKARVAEIYADERSLYAFSSIHRAKGLESQNVFILRPDLVPHPMALKSENPQVIAQEHNALFVAITRAQSNLFYVQTPTTK